MFTIVCLLLAVTNALRGIDLRNKYHNPRSPLLKPLNIHQNQRMQNPVLFQLEGEPFATYENDTTVTDTSTATNTLTSYTTTSTNIQLVTETYTTTSIITETDTTTTITYTETVDYDYDYNYTVSVEAFVTNTSFVTEVVYVTSTTAVN
jgi:hypothetical protein